MKILTRKCQQCGKDYHKKPNVGIPYWNAGKSKYCSLNCQHQGLKGHTTWNKGLKLQPLTEAHKGKISQKLAGKLPKNFGNGFGGKNEKHPGWKGEKVSYVGNHKWVARNKGRPKKCEECGTITAKKYEWANKDHKYKRILEDYIRMCTSCHRKYDYALTGK